MSYALRSEKDPISAKQQAAMTASIGAADAALTPAQRAALIAKIGLPGQIYGGGTSGIGNYVKDAQGQYSVPLPYPGAPHDGGPQDLANTAAIIKATQNYNSAQYVTANQPSFIDKLIPALAIGMATAGVGSGVSGAVGNALGSTVAGNIAGGVAAGGLGSAVQGRNPLVGAALGGVGGALGSISSPVTSALTNAGVNPTLASGLVKGAIGAGTGALGGALTGGSASRGALIGGIGGAAAGALGQYTGSPAIGNLGGTIAGAITNRASAPSAPKPPVVAPTVASAQPSAMPVMPGATQPGVSTGTQNIGSYSGYGYAPRTLTQNPVKDYSTYGQGPEAQFYTTNAGVTPPPASTVAATAAPAAPNFATAPVMSNTQSSGINPINRA